MEKAIYKCDECGIEREGQKYFFPKGGWYEAYKLKKGESKTRHYCPKCARGMGLARKE